MAKPKVVEAGNRDEGPKSLKIGAAFWVVEVIAFVWGYVSFGEAAFNINSPDFFPVPLGLILFTAAFGTFYVLRGLVLMSHFDKFGTSKLDASNATPGKPYRGKIRTEHDIAAQGPFSLRLLCVRQTKSSGDYDGDGSNSIVTTPLWEAVATVPASTRSSIGIPFQFAIPDDAERTLSRAFSEGHNIKWTLHVTAPLQGLDYSAEFPVDVGGGNSNKATSGTAAKRSFAGTLRPEQTWMKIARFVAPVFGILFFGAGAYGTIVQAFHGGIPFAGRIVSVNMPSVDVALDEGGTVTVARVTRNSAWQVDQPVRVSCVEDGATLRACRMETGGDRWIDAVGTLVVGSLLLLLSLWLWRRYLMYRHWMTVRTE